MSTPLTLVEAIRKRPGMYIGSTERLGLAHLYEYVFQMFLEAEAPTQLRITRSLGQISIQCDVVLAAESLIETLISANHTNTMMSHWPLVTASALSSQFSLDVQSEHGWWSFRSERGQPVEGQPLRTHIGPGTIVTFSPDPTIFRDVDAVKAAWLQRRMRELAMLYPGLSIALVDVEGLSFQLRWPRGFTDWLESQEVSLERSLETAWGEVRIRAAFGFDHRVPASVLGFVNNVRVPGGQHVEAVRRAIANRWPDETRAAIAVIALDMPIDRVQFSGPTREVLAVEGLGDGVYEALREALAL